MKPFLVLSALILIILSASVASAQCQHSTDACVTSISLSASAIPGDQFTETVATGQIHIPSSANGTLIALELQIDASLDVTKVSCGSGTDGVPPESGYSLACGARNLTGDVSISVSLAGLNGGPGIQTGLVHAIVYGFPSENKPTTPLEIDPVTAYTETPDRDPDGPCPTCGYGGPPINFTNGNTYFRQQDYSIPGLAGGLTLARTWNSMWSRKLPPETVGLFGDSWRSNFEERIQVVGNTAKYWKGDGSLLFYNWNGSAYVLTAPANDATTLSYDPNAMQWTAQLKDGTRNASTVPATSPRLLTATGTQRPSSLTPPTRIGSPASPTPAA